MLALLVPGVGMGAGVAAPARVESPIAFIGAPRRRTRELWSLDEPVAVDESALAVIRPFPSLEEGVTVRSLDPQVGARVDEVLVEEGPVVLGRDGDPGVLAAEALAAARLLLDDEVRAAGLGRGVAVTDLERRVAALLLEKAVEAWPLRYD